MTSYKELTAWIDSSALHQQVQNVDAAGLFSNPWFIVPFLVFVATCLYHKNLMTLFFTGVVIGAWYLCGTSLMQGLGGDGGLNMDKIFPVLAVGAVVALVAVILFFARSD